MDQGTTQYQIAVKWSYQSFDGQKTYYSKNVFTSTPSQEEIDKFIDLCCGDGLFDLERENIEIRVLSLILNIND